MRRANDVSQDAGFAPAPSAGKHDDAEFGTHHARDASALLSTIGWEPPIFSSAMKLNTQYMHSLWFDMEVSKAHDQGERHRAPARQPADRADRAPLFQPDLLVRPRPRVLRPHPVAGGHLHADAGGQGRQRDHRLLLHAPGRQLARVLDQRRPVAHGSRREAAGRADVGAGPVLLPGDLETQAPRTAGLLPFDAMAWVTCPHCGFTQIPSARCLKCHKTLERPRRGSGRRRPRRPLPRVRPASRKPSSPSPAPTS